MLVFIYKIEISTSIYVIFILSNKYNMSSSYIYQSHKEFSLLSYKEILDDISIFIKDIESIIIQYLLPVYDFRQKTLDKLTRTHGRMIIGDTSQENINFFNKKYGVNSDYVFLILLSNMPNYFIWINHNDNCQGLFFHFDDGYLVCNKRLLFQINQDKSDFNAVPFRFKLNKLIHKSNYCNIVTNFATFQIDDYALLYKSFKCLPFRTRDDFSYKKNKLFKEEYYQLSHIRNNNIFNNVPISCFSSYGHYQLFNSARLLMDYYERDILYYKAKVRDACIYL